MSSSNQTGLSAVFNDRLQATLSRHARYAASCRTKMLCLSAKQDAERGDLALGHRAMVAALMRMGGAVFHRIGVRRYTFDQTRL
ncbi:hypothetical protein LBW46_26505, partial [Ralstonia solanacearum]|uniref:hypothetical protein n=1 Tax=Ralstonia solanacearum TaxID=305 RepID=UPI002305CBC0